MESYNDLIEKIKNHTLGNKEEASALYFAFCDCLKEKYGLVDRDFDDNPTKRGKEWIDIHHIREYELDNIANRTEEARAFERKQRNPFCENQIVIALKSSEWNDAKMEEIRKQYPDKSIAFWGLEYSLEELKPYNAKEQLVYANKIEHFLLHYLIASMHDSGFAGGPNYLWDCCVALDLCGFDKPYMNHLKSVKNDFYSILSSEEVTFLYKNLMDWRGWEALDRSRYWANYKIVIRNLEEDVSYVEDKEKFFKLIDILGFTLNQDIKNKILTLPFKAKIIDLSDGTKAKIINYNIYSMDEKTVYTFAIKHSLESFTVPATIEKIAEGAFRFGFHLKKITIPITVKEIEDKAFIPLTISGLRRCPFLQEIYYRGTKEMWDADFSNVELPNGVRVVCKKK